MSFTFDLSVVLQICTALTILISVITFIWRMGGQFRDMKRRLETLEAKAGKVDVLEKSVDRIGDLERRAEHRKQDTKMTLRGLVACLEGLKEQGCNGKVTTTLKELNDYIMDSR